MDMPLVRKAVLLQAFRGVAWGTTSLVLVVYGSIVGDCHDGVPTCYEDQAISDLNNAKTVPCTEETIAASRKKLEAMLS